MIWFNLILALNFMLLETRYHTLPYSMMSPVITSFIYWVKRDTQAAEA